MSHMGATPNFQPARRVRWKSLQLVRSAEVPEFRPVGVVI